MNLNIRSARLEFTHSTPCAPCGGAADLKGFAHCRRPPVAGWLIAGCWLSRLLLPLDAFWIAWGPSGDSWRHFRSSWRASGGSWGASGGSWEYFEDSWGSCVPGRYVFLCIRLPQGAMPEPNLIWFRMCMQNTCFLYVLSIFASWGALGEHLGTLGAPK